MKSEERLPAGRQERTKGRARRMVFLCFSSLVFLFFSFFSPCFSQQNEEEPVREFVPMTPPQPAQEEEVQTAKEADQENLSSVEPARESPQASASAVVPEKPAVEETIPGGMDGFVSLDLRDIDIIDALKFLSRKAGLDIVTTKNVGGRITLMVENVPVKDVFDIMLRSNKLAYDKRGKIYSVMTEEEFRALYGKSSSDTREVVTFRLKYAIPEQAFSLLDALKSEIGRVLVDPESGHVLVIDIPQRVREMAKALDAFEEKNVVKVFALQYSKARDIEEQLRTQLDVKKVGLIVADERGNQVLVQTLPDRMTEIERMIRLLDRKTKEVVIDTRIIKVTLNNTTTKGFEWEGLSNALQKSRNLLYVGSTPFASVQSSTAGFSTRESVFSTLGGQVGSYPFSGTTSDFSSSSPKVSSEEMHVGIVTKQADADAVLKYILALGTVKILANPKLVVTNNQESKIHVGEKQAYVTTTTTTGQVTATVAENVTFVDIGTQVSVTPVINDDGYVTMKVKTEISSVTNTLVTPSQNKIPIIDSSEAETTVMVKDGTTVIIAGLKKDEKNNNYKQTPLLGSIPLIGELFKSGTYGVVHTELIIMMTPRIISGDVLVTEAGQKVESAGIKGRQDYNVLKPIAKEAAIVSPMDISLTDNKKVVMKGLRVLE